MSFSEIEAYIQERKIDILIAYVQTREESLCWAFLRGQKSGDLLKAVQDLISLLSGVVAAGAPHGRFASGLICSVVNIAYRDISRCVV